MCLHLFQMENLQTELIHKKYITINFYSMIIIESIISALLLYSNELGFFVGINFCLLLFKSFLYVYLYNKKISFIYATLPFCLIMLSLILFSILTIFFKHSALSLIWFIPILIFVDFFHKLEKMIYWVAFIGFLIVCCLIINSVIEIPIKLIMTKDILMILNALSIISLTFFLLLSLYFKKKLLSVSGEHQIKHQNNSYVEITADIITDEEIGSGQIINDDSTLKLYNEIIELFNRDKPYLDPGFSTSRLADLLQSNVSYISKAINSNSGLNFNSFLNKYRIEYLKEMMKDEEECNRYKITYLYMQVGFTNQSTFNKAFKQVEGITPSQYMKRTSDN